MLTGGGETRFSFGEREKNCIRKGNWRKKGVATQRNWTDLPRGRGDSLSFMTCPGIGKREKKEVAHIISYLLGL